jgi:DNA-binding response OmpR family regulator
MRILLIEDQSRLANEIALKLRQSGYDVDQAATIAEAISVFDTRSHALAMLDRRLPDGDGMSLIPHFRKQRSNIRIMILTALDAVDDRIEGLDAGADDYLTKPIDLDEMMARIRAHLRSQGSEQARVVSVGKLSFDLQSRSVMVANAPVVFLRRELALLETLVTNLNCVVPRETLNVRIYGEGDVVQEHALTALVSRLRLRLDELGADVEIHAARGLGYMMRRAKGTTNA